MIKRKNHFLHDMWFIGKKKKKKKIKNDEKKKINIEYLKVHVQ